MIRRLLTLVWLLCAGLAQAQDTQTPYWPDYDSTTVNDFASLLDADAEARITDQLNTLREDTGVEMTVVTISRQETYTYGLTPEPTIEEFARGLFDHWGVGDAERNDGVMVLVAHTDREMRIELGKAYGQGWNNHAADVLDRSFLPAFREDRYQDGIEAGVTDTIDSLIRPFLAGEDAPAQGPEIGWLLFGGIAAFMFGIPAVGAVRRRLERCPNCQKRNMTHKTETLRQATKTRGGRKRTVVTCPHCGHSDERFFDTSRIRSSSSSSFGGGSSGGGGATGRW